MATEVSFLCAALAEEWVVLPPVLDREENEWVANFYKWRSIERRFKVMDYLSVCEEADLQFRKRYFLAEFPGYIC